MKIEISCLIAAVLFFVSNAIGFSLFNVIRHESGGTWGNYHFLEPHLISSEFDHEHFYFWKIAAGILSSIAWMVFCIPLIQVAWIGSKHGTFLVGTHAAMVVLALGASFIELISRLLFIGSTMAMYWMADYFNLKYWVYINDGDIQPTLSNQDKDLHGDKIGWRVLEMIHITTQGMTHWIDTAEWLFLAAIYFLIYVSVSKSEVSHFARNWARFGLLLGAIAFFDFASDVMRFRSYFKDSWVPLLFNALSRFILMPIWLVWLGKQLPVARSNAIAAATARKENPSIGNASSVDLDAEAPTFA